jgi:hypothetical protein
MSLLTQALQDIDYWIENSKTWHAEWIRSFGVRPGLERDMIDLYAEEYDFRFSEEIYELYQWHDGDIRIGDNANPIFFVPLDRAVTNIVTGHFPYLPYMPLFIGDECYYLTPEASEGQKTSPILALMATFLKESQDHAVIFTIITMLLVSLASCKQLRSVQKPMTVFQQCTWMAPPKIGILKIHIYVIAPFSPQFMKNME